MSAGSPHRTPLVNLKVLHLHTLSQLRTCRFPPYFDRSANQSRRSAFSLRQSRVIVGNGAKRSCIWMVAERELCANSAVRSEVRPPKLRSSDLSGFQDVQPGVDIGGVVRTRFQRDPKVGTEEGATQLGHELFHSIGVIAEAIGHLDEVRLGGNGRRRSGRQGRLSPTPASASFNRYCNRIFIQHELVHAGTGCGKNNRPGGCRPSARSTYPKSNPSIGPYAG